MDDLISRRALIDAFKEEFYYMYSDDFNYMVNWIKNFPTAEHKGRWVSDNGMWACSVCGNVIYAINKADLKVFNAYCGMCGARMEDSDG